VVKIGPLFSSHRTFFSSSYPFHIGIFLSIRDLGKYWCAGLPVLTIAKSYPFEINPQALKGNWKEGWALDVHTRSSTPSRNEMGVIVGWKTVRPPLAEALFRLKYRNERHWAQVISEVLYRFWLERNPEWKIDLIVPVPPSVKDRLFQPVTEMAIRFGGLAGVPVGNDAIQKVKNSVQIKQLNDSEQRRLSLRDSFTVDAGRLHGKNILLFDDLYRSGETLDAVCQAIRDQTDTGSIYVMTVTKTRTKR